MKLLLHVKGFLSFDGLAEIGPLLDHGSMDGAMIEPNGLLSILKTADLAEESKRYIKNNRALCPRLYHLTEALPTCGFLAREIRRAIEAHGDIKDAASPALRRIRRKKRESRRELQKRLENFQRTEHLNTEGKDALVTLREGRYVIPIRMDMKHRVQGIIHDYSNTQSTCFFEPLEVVEDNNRLAELSHLEREEEISILRYLASLVRESHGDLQEIQAVLGRLDGLNARATLSDELNCVRPIMNENGVINLREARNPILLSSKHQSRSTVPVDLRLDGTKNILIISGPNRGGKTVTLKTLGLLSLMAQSGLHIPAAEGSTLPVLRNIFAEIGDDQDIQAGLSTFSAHMEHLKMMMDLADPESLAIIDEPGMGTDPNEGAAIAMAVLDDLSHKGVRVAVSTHYSRLKSYALMNDKAENASMEFDTSSNRPTFTLRYGYPGISYATEIAHDTGISPEVLERAKAYLDKDEIQLNRLIDKLYRLNREAALERERATSTERKYHAAKQRISQAMAKLETEKKAILEEKRAEAERLLKQAEAEFGRLINSLKKNGREHLSQVELQDQYEQLTHKVKGWVYGDEDPDPIDENAFRQGQWVRHKIHQQIGTILSVDRDRSKAMIACGNLKFSVSLKDLCIIQNPLEGEEIEGKGSIVRHDMKDPRREINLIGYRVGDALPLIDKMIDRALVEGDGSLRIIHGYGTGKLKQAIREHLRALSCVKNIQGEDPQHGGEAITLVELN
jgi:DNA mismatch repair protein MutS2